MVFWHYEELSDDTGQVVRLSCNPERGSNFPTGSTNVSCTAVDDRNNEVECQFVVNVCKSNVYKSKNRDNIKCFVRSQFQLMKPEI